MAPFFFPIGKHASLQATAEWVKPVVIFTIRNERQESEKEPGECTDGRAEQEPFQE
jgi:hypothetical protein